MTGPAPARPLRLLVVAMTGSVHVARWLAQVAREGWSIDVFSSSPSGITHPGLGGTTVHHLLYVRPVPGVRQRGVRAFSPVVTHLGERLADRLRPGWRARRLAALIEATKPDVVHSMEIQHSGYVTLDARRLLGGRFPPWIVTNWGSDISYFGRFPEHARRIREVLEACDGYSCECRRDVALAREYGYLGPVLSTSPNAGGLDLALAGRLRSGPPSGRRLIMVKGYQTWVGRALVALAALERCADVLAGYRLCVYSATPDVARRARSLASSLGIPAEILPIDRGLPHVEMLRRHGEARVSVGLSMADGVSTSFLETLAMGSFPIQSWTACANEWVTDGESGLLVDPEDEQGVATALRRALTEDALVDSAAERNGSVTRERLDEGVLARQAVAMYRDFLAGTRGGGSGPAPGGAA